VHAAAAHLGAGAVALAARNRTEKDLEAIDSAVSELAQAVANAHATGDPITLAVLGETERQLMAKIVSASGNRSLELVIEAVGFVTSAAMRKEIDRHSALLPEDEAMVEEALTSIREVVEHIRAKRVEDARSAFFDYMMTTRERMLANSQDLVEILS